MSDREEALPFAARCTRCSLEVEVGNGAALFLTCKVLSAEVMVEALSEGEWPEAEAESEWDCGGSRHLFEQTRGESVEGIQQAEGSE